MNVEIVFAILVVLLSIAYLIFKFFVKQCDSRILFSSPVYICNSAEDWKNNERLFLKRFYKAGFIGLDCEWVTVDDRRNPVALLQLATADGLCVLIRLCKIPSEFIPSSLVNCLFDPSIIKVGVGVLEDAQKLLQDYNLEVRSCLDLRNTVQNIPDFQGKGPGLKVLSDKLLSVNLKKDPFLACSDWEAEVLNTDQVAYAAEDALASAQIFSHLIESGNSIWRQIWCCHPSTSKKFEEFVDMPFKPKMFSLSASGSQSKTSKQDSSKPVHYKKLFTRSKPMYENCQLQAPDGEVLCSCDRSKAMWYVNKGRGEIIKQNPLTVRLNFEPSDRPILDNAYYIKEKANCCVVCGETKFFFRKQIVPSEYRKHFPELMKKSLSHDVLLLCVSCHRKSNIADQELRETLSKECDAPIGKDRYIKVKGHLELSKIKSAAKALTYSGHKIPEKRKEELKNMVKEFYKEEVTDELLKKLTDLEIEEINKDYAPHGLKVYQYFCENKGLIALEVLWRKHFLDTMNPKFLPAMWSVDHNHERLAVKILKKKVDFDVSILGLTPEMLERAKDLI